MEALTTKQLVAKLQIAHDSAPVWSHVQELLQLAMKRLEEQDDKIDSLRDLLADSEERLETLLNCMGDMP